MGVLYAAAEMAVIVASSCTRRCRPRHPAGSRTSAVTGPAAHARHAAAASGNAAGPAVDPAGAADRAVRARHAAATAGAATRSVIGAAGAALTVDTATATRVERDELDSCDAARHLPGDLRGRERCGGQC